MKTTFKIFSYILLFLAIFFSWKMAYGYYVYLSYPRTPIAFKSTVIGSYLAADEADRIQGLSGKSFLPSNTGMLFMFDSPDIHGIWMKEMKFPLDVIWMNERKEIIYFASNVSPDTYPRVFYPTSKAAYVLEVRAGFVADKNLKVGDVAYFDI